MMEHRKLLERELDILRDRLLLMGGEVELALQLEIDRLSVEVLTLRRPIARELRMVISIFKT